MTSALEPRGRQHRGCPSDGLIDELLALVREDEEYFNSSAEVDRARRRGTSADRQLALYQHQLDRGLTPSQTLKAIVDQLVVETVATATAFGPAVAACA